MTKPDHTIIMLGFNNHELTLTAIEHLRTNGCQDPILFIDNGSEPSFEQALATCPDITYQRKNQNCYVNPVWNEVFEQAETRFITLLNNDCFLLTPNYFAEVIPHMTAHRIVLSSAKTLRVKSLPTQIKSNFIQSIRERKPPRFRDQTRRQGWLMTLDLKRYRRLNYRIPDDYRIWFGDDWIWSQVMLNGLTAGVYTNRFALHLNTPVTYSPHIARIIEQDKKNLTEKGAWFRKALPLIHRRTRIFSRYA